MTIVYLDEKFLQHETGRHPECPARLKAIHQELASSGLMTKVTQLTASPAQEEDLLRIHTPEHLTHLSRYAAAGGGRIEADTVMSVASADVARRACGAATDAVEKVISGKDNTALCLVRPPGHHALPGAPMGFCLLNNAAVAARTAVQKFGLRRVLVVDWDVHHGNGTQDAFYDDEHVWFFSAHRYPFYPGSGQRTETGTAAGLGTIFNLPLQFGISRKDYLTAFENLLTTAADQCRPELVILSAGFDAHAQDPVGSLGLETEDFEPLTTLLQQVAKTWAKGKLVSLLEGGYHTQRLAECVSVHLRTLISGQNTASPASQIP